MEPQTPLTWQRALELWDAGEPLAVFQVESEGTPQSRLWGAAFEGLRQDFTSTEVIVMEKAFTKREIDVVNSIVAVAKLEPWDVMVRRHTDADKSPAVTIQKPKPDETPK